MVERGHAELSMVRQCDLLDIHRSGLYYEPRPESALNLELMRLIDEHYLDHPYKGARRMYLWLTMDKGYEVSKNRIERLYYEKMGLRSLLPGPHTSKRCKDHVVYPYLLRELEIDRPNQVWATDITYVPMPMGYLYLTAFIDLYSRYVLNWSLSNLAKGPVASCGQNATYSIGHSQTPWMPSGYQQALAEAISLYGKPEIINTDQGSQYTSEVFSQYVTQGQGIRLSMDGKGRATDNAFIERLWRSVKYEHIYIRPHKNGAELYEGLSRYMNDYNHHRRHQSINDRFPKDVYVENKKTANGLAA